MPGTVFSLTGSAQRFLRLSYVGCPLEMIPEGIPVLTGKSTGCCKTGQRMLVIHFVTSLCHSGDSPALAQ